MPTSGVWWTSPRMAATFQMLATLAEQLVVYGELADLGLEAGHQLIPIVGRSALRGGGATVEEGIPSTEEHGGDDLQHPGEGVEALAPLVSVLVLLLSISGTPFQSHFGSGECPEKTSG